MVDLTLVLDEPDLRGRFGSATYERAVDYVRRGKVMSCSHQVDEDGDLDIRGNVEGSVGEIYACNVSVGQSGPGVWTYGRCSCPVREGCKHAVALLLTVRARQAEEYAAGGGGDRRWERQLSSVLDELDAVADGPVATRPLAIQVELNQRTSAPRFRGAGEQLAPRRGSLRLRPLQRGARDNWVRSGISWQGLQHVSDRSRSGFPPEQAALLAEIFAAYRAAQRNLYFGGAESHLVLAAFGGSLWSLLGRCSEAGVELVPGAGLDRVNVHPGPVSIELDVNAAPTRDAHLRLGVRAAEVWHGAEDIDVLGESGHGVALWLPGDKPQTWSVTLAPLAKPAGPQVRRLLGMSEQLVVPAADRADLVAEYLPRLQRHVPVVSSDGSVALPEPVEPRLCLTVEWKDVDEVRLTWSWRYRIGEDDRIYRLDESRGLRGVRRPEREQELLADLGSSLNDEQVHRLYGGHRREAGLIAEIVFHDVTAIAFAEEVLPGLEAGGLVEIEEIGVRPDYREAREGPVIRFAAAERGEGDSDEGRTDWLDLEVVISVDGQFIALAHLLEALTVGVPRIIMKSGLHISTDHPEFRKLAELVDAAGELHDQPRDGVRVNHHDLGLWDELAEVGIVDAQADQWVRAAQALRGVEALPEVEPTGLEAELRHYQRDGFRWLAFLWEAGLGGILADDMGLGKTLQTLALIAHARERGAGPFLVVAPTSVLSTWAHEAAAFTPGLVVETVTESHSRRGTSIASVSEGADVVITSYTLYRLEVDSYAALRWGGLVLDEAQTVKNHNGKTYQCVRRLDVPFRLALTGTPLENRLMELWSLLSIVAPGLYPYPQRFVEQVANPVERLGDMQVLQRFRRRIRPFLLRRTKELVASDLPAKQEQVLEVRLTPRHRRIYETHLQRERQTVLGLVEDFDKHRMAIFRSLTRLRQLSLDAGLVDEEYDGVGSAKIDVLADHLEELRAEGHRALVFSQFTSFLRRVRARLDREGIASTYLDGSTRNRGEVIEEFKGGDAAVFLISLKAGGVGLTLTEADYVFVLDPWWNPAVEAQAVDRAHRIGQRRPVMVYRLVAADTIEEKVMELKARKAALFAQVVDGDGSMGTPIDAADVRALFGD
ncbi:MAG TPA: DEAD/DEAH box helicase [Pedococcus sp.]|nr:DEAD/DEAH box helicase [Pedococcus sp.]